MSSIFAIVLSIQDAHSAEILSQNSQRYYENDSPKIIADIHITAQEENEITKEHGISILIPDSLNSTWDRSISKIQLSGKAVELGRVQKEVAVEYPGNMAQIAHFSIDQDFLEGEEIVVSGLRMKFYSTENSYRFLEIDINGDLKADAADLNGIRIDNSTRSDSIPPDPVVQVSAKQTSENSVALSWVNPPDLDIEETEIIRRKQNINGVTDERSIIVPSGIDRVGLKETYEDKENIKAGDYITYELFARDRRSSSLGVKIALKIISQAEIETCESEGAPVCGSDDVTYKNYCDAYAVGVVEYKEGGCMKDEQQTPSEQETPDSQTEVDTQEPSENPDISQKFSDLEEGHWARAFFEELIIDEVFSGYPDGSIKPDKKINRAEMAKIVTLAFGESEENATELSFRDIPQGVWYEKYVSFLKSKEALWTTLSRYFPSEEVTRAEGLWVMLKIVGADVESVEETQSPFPDLSEDHKYYKAVIWALNNNIIDGYVDGTFGPEDTITRAQAAKMISLLKKLTLQSDHSL